MSKPLILASTSPVRLALLANAGLAVHVIPSLVDEETLQSSLAAEGATPRDQADVLSEAKARKIALKNPSALVIGCDQTLDFKGKLFTKPANLGAARDQLLQLRGQTHHLHSAVVVYEDAQPVWRHIAKVSLQMCDFSDAYLESYLQRNATQVLHACGGYMLEGEGVRLFDRIEGDYFAVLGLPLIPLLTWLRQRGLIPA